MHSLYVRPGSGQFLVKSDMLYSFSNFSNKLDSIKTKHILWVEVCLVFMKNIYFLWDSAHVSKEDATS